MYIYILLLFLFLFLLLLYTIVIKNILLLYYSILYIIFIYLSIYIYVLWNILSKISGSCKANRWDSAPTRRAKAKNHPTRDGNLVANQKKLGKP